MGKEPIKSHEDLEVYKMAFDAAMQIFEFRTYATGTGDRSMLVSWYYHDWHNWYKMWVELRFGTW